MKKAAIITLACALTLIGASESRGESPYATVISNASNIKSKEYPLRNSISDSSIGKVKFLDPGSLKNNIGTLIVVLGDRPLDGTIPTVDMVYRVLKGVELSKKYPDSILIMSGGTTAGDISEAEMMGLIAWSRGVDASRIVLEDKSRNTEQNAEFTAKIVISKNIAQKFIITDQSRLDRAIKIFKNYFREFKDVQGVDCEVPAKLIAQQMEQYLKTNDNLIVRRRLEQFEKTENSVKTDEPKNAGETSGYGKVISNASGSLTKKFPMRRSISESAIAKIKFSDPQDIKNNTETAVFVLPNRPLDKVTPSVDSVYRALKAVELAKKFPGAALVILGPKTVGDISEGRMMALVAWSRGVDPSQIFLEERARSIEDKAEFIARIVTSKNVGHSFIVAKKEHLQRIIPYFQRHLKEKFKNIEGADCGVTKEMIITQMEEYLITNDDKIVRRRLNNVKNGRIGID